MNLKFSSVETVTFFQILSSLEKKISNNLLNSQSFCKFFFRVKIFLSKKIIFIFKII
jgi:hypothetical protein